MRYLFYVLGFLTSFNYSFADAKINLCVEHLSNASVNLSSFENYDKLEKNFNAFFIRLEPLMSEVQQKLESGQYSNMKEASEQIQVLETVWFELSDLHVRLEKIGDKILNGISPSSLDLKDIFDKLVALKSTFEDSKLNLQTLDQSSATLPTQNTDYSGIIENPSRVIADYEYNVDSPTGFFTIVFSPEIVEDVFNDSRNVPVKTISRSLKDATKGIYGGSYEGTGIIRYNSDRNVVEIRSIGKDANFRLYGYVLNSNKIHIVHYTVASNHGSANFSSQVRNKVYAAKIKRGH